MPPWELHLEASMCLRWHVPWVSSGSMLRLPPGPGTGGLGLGKPSTFSLGNGAWSAPFADFGDTSHGNWELPVLAEETAEWDRRKTEMPQSGIG